MKDLWKIAFGVVCGLLAAGLIVLLARPPRGASLALSSPPTPAPLRVHVAGAVAKPGVYALPAGSRAEDAVRAAGGLLPKADAGLINLAAGVEDGAQILVPFIMPTPPPTPTPVPQTAAPTITWSPAFTPYAYVRPSKDNPVNINTADQPGLEALPDIGDYRARQILAYRTVHGPFKRIEDLLKVPGIPQTTYEIIKELVTVGDGELATATPTATPAQ